LGLVKAGSSERLLIARSYLLSLFGRGEATLGSLFRDVEKVFAEFSCRPPFAFGAEASTLAGPKIDVSRQGCN
jgi:hypothetical protein